MSVRAMSTMAARSGAGKGNAKAALDTTLGKIAAFIPSEILALYLFMWGVANPAATDRRTPWALFWASLGALVAYVVLNHMLDRKSVAESNEKIADRAKRAQGPTATKTGWVLLMAAVAFTAYAASLPQTPFLDVNSNANTIGAIVAAGLAIFLPMIGKLVGVSPDTD